MINALRPASAGEHVNRSKVLQEQSSGIECSELLLDALCGSLFLSRQISAHLQFEFLLQATRKEFKMIKRIKEADKHRLMSTVW